MRKGYFDLNYAMFFEPEGGINTPGEFTEELLAWIEELEQVVPNAIDDARERFDQFLNQLEHNDTIASAIEELYEL